MAMICEFYLSNELPGIGRIFASVYTDLDSRTDKIRAEVVYGTRGVAGSGIRMYADPTVSGPIVINESFVHDEAKDWLRNHAVFIQNELFIQTHDWQFTGRMPEFKAVDERGLLRLWFCNAETKSFRVVRKLSEMSHVHIVLDRVMRCPQVEIHSIKTDN